MQGDELRLVLIEQVTHVGLATAIDSRVNVMLGYSIDSITTLDAAGSERLSPSHDCCHEK